MGGDADASEPALLRAACAGDAEAVAALYDRHAAALYAIACWVLGPTRSAEDVVVGVVVDACSDRGATALDPARPLREELARLTVARCAAVEPLTGSARAGAALALCLHGGHSVTSASRLTGVTRADVAARLRTMLAARRLRRPA